MENNKSVTTFEQHLDNRYGVIGSEKRMAFEAKGKAFAIGEPIKEKRRLAKMTTQQNNTKS